MRSRLRFLSEFVRNPKQLGSITPSSRFLARELLGRIDFERTRRIVELGPGTGVFTVPLLERLAPDAALIAIDTNEGFVAQLRREIQDPRLTVLHDSAERVDRIVADAGWGHADLVVSGIPYSLLPRPLRLSILESTCRCLRHDGKFIGYQYSLMLRPYLLRVFGNVHYRSVLLNIPPAFVYESRAQRSG
ncbi:MAG: methyltransferase domain-containing protein [Chloroflexi bacterium]|nr:methyltransferase domain-containing protein [Chloroflexota bacterium]